MDIRLFQPRVPQLRKLEGWYDAERLPHFKISCRYKDILRCAEFNGKTEHFTSCFRSGRFSAHPEQPRLRCYDPTWAIAYVPDKHGNFMGRAWIRFAYGCYEVGRVHGNNLTVKDLMATIVKNIDVMVDCRYNPTDTYL